MFFDQSMLVNVLESYYNDKESLYQNREDASFPSVYHQLIMQ